MKRWRLRAFKAAIIAGLLARKKARQRLKEAKEAGQAAKEAALAAGKSRPEARSIKRAIRKSARKEARAIKRVEGKERATRIRTEARAKHNPEIADYLTQFEVYASGARPKFDFRLALGLMAFAEDAYREEKTLQRIENFALKERPNFVLYKTVGAGSNQGGSPDKSWVGTTAYLFVDKQSEQVVLTFRGTTGVPPFSKAWRTNLHGLDWSVVEWLHPRGDQAEETQHNHVPPCAVHKGFYLAYNTVREALLEEVRLLSPSQLHVTGHSLGGALATLGALDLKLEFPFMGVSMYNFGSPRVGERMFAVFYNRIMRDSHRVVLPGDPVPLVPPRQLGYQHVDQEHTLRADIEESVVGAGPFSQVDGIRRHSAGREEELKCYRHQMCKEASST